MDPLPQSISLEHPAINLPSSLLFLPLSSYHKPPTNHQLPIVLQAAYFCTEQYSCAHAACRLNQGRDGILQTTEVNHSTH
jgi:hypothetical protein